jgi:hypothetical protein
MQHFFGFDAKGPLASPRGFIRKPPNEKKYSQAFWRLKAFCDPAGIGCNGLETL